jgi:hypothetical protein
MFNKKRLFFTAIILLGSLDWLTTIIGIASNGSIEINPLLSGLTKSSMVVFSIVKLSADVVAAFAFYKAEAISIGQTVKNFLNGAFSVTCLIFVTVVVSNLLTITRF